MNRIGVIGLLLMGVTGMHIAASAANLSINVRVNTNRIGMGRTVALQAQARLADGQPAAGWTLLPYVNGQRWGAHETTDSRGRATFHLPLPRVGIQELSVGAVPTIKDPSDWIWADKVSDNQTVTLRRTFTLKTPPTQTRIWVAADDQATVYVNGQKLHTFGGWSNLKPVKVPASALRVGENLIDVHAVNSVGPAGLLFRMELDTQDGQQLVTSDASWKVQGDPGADPVRVIANGSEGTWPLTNWPGAQIRKQLFTGAVMPDDMPRSRPMTVRVERRTLQPPPKDPKHLVVMQWENWYSEVNYWWTTNQAVPLVGLYRTSDENVMRQHIIWMIESGTDVIQCDMSNNIWFLNDWSERPPGVNDLLFLNELMLETLAKMRDEGIDVPQFMALSGVNWTPNGVKVINQQLDHLHHIYLNNYRWKDLWLRYEDKPLIILLDLPGAFQSKLSELDPRWTIRFASVNMETNVKQREAGFWSWMDNAATLVRNEKGEPEAVTASVGCFNDGGWLDPGSRGRRGGATLVEDWRVVMAERPRFVFLHQFQEFAGQMEGQGHGPNNDRYVDSYSVDLSDDIEPTSLTAAAYRGNGGWGFFYLNLTRALVDLYRQKQPETTVMVVAKPDRRHEVTGDTLDLHWRVIGRTPPEGVTVFIDGKRVASGLTGEQTAVDITGLRPGLHRIRLEAPGTAQRYRLSWTEDALPLSTPEPAWVEMEFMRR